MKWLLTNPALENSAFPSYADWVQDAGIATEIVRPSWPLPLAEEFDALLLTGGADIDPSRYDQFVHPMSRDLQPDRDDMEFRLLERFLRSRRPVLGICRGLQMVQVFLGGKLIQHIPDFVAAEQERHSRSGDEDSMHRVSWSPSSSMAGALGGQITECNSAHHQAADPTTIAEGLTVAAKSVHGIVEAVERVADDGSFVSCVQWHPERLNFDHPASGSLRDYWVGQVRRCAEVDRPVRTETVQLGRRLAPPLDLVPVGNRQ